MAGVLPAAPRLPPYAARPPHTNVHERLIGSDTIVSAGVLLPSWLLVLTPGHVFCPWVLGGKRKKSEMNPTLLPNQRENTLGWNVSVSDCSRCSWTSKLEVLYDVTHQGEKIKAFVPTFLLLLRLFQCVGGASPVSWLESLHVPVPRDLLVSLRSEWETLLQDGGWRRQETRGHRNGASCSVAPCNPNVVTEERLGPVSRV